MNIFNDYIFEISRVHWSKRNVECAIRLILISKSAQARCVILGHFGIIVMTENLTMTLNQTQQLLDLFWDSDDLKMFDNQTNTLFASIITITATIILVLGGIVHRAIFKLLRRIPQRPINILIYPTLVSICLSILLRNEFLCQLFRVLTA